MFERIDISRRESVLHLDQATRSDLGQYFTPYRIASFMASLFSDNGLKDISLLDAGAGIGSLSAAFLERFGKHPYEQIQVTAYELDKTVAGSLRPNLADLADYFQGQGIQIVPEIIEDDFLKAGVVDYLLGRHKSVDYAILNPPYRKINSDSLHRRLLRKVGVETVNLYSGFVALAILLLKDGGELVAIIPRSFCNGLYYRPFREFLLEKTAIRQIHIFNARDKAFKEDGVLQENIIIHLVKGGNRGKVRISSSTDDGFVDLQEFAFPFDRIVSPEDTEKFIHIPIKEEKNLITTSENFVYSLSDIDVEVSTGPVVDFRVKEFLRGDPVPDAAPLLYPAHFGEKNINWPKSDFKKSNALIIAPETRKQLFPSGCYTLVRRFSAKEEKRRIVARVVLPDDLPGDFIGFENHLNVFHFKKKGLPEELALGIAVYLNSTLVDQYFRQFNGHTQVNATDLRLLKYPHKRVLFELGKWAKNLPDFDQETVDTKIATLL